MSSVNLFYTVTVREWRGWQHLDACWHTVCCICATGQALRSQSLFHSGRLRLFAYQHVHKCAAVLMCNQSPRCAWCGALQARPKSLRICQVTSVQGSQTPLGDSCSLVEGLEPIRRSAQQGAFWREV
jgi:hypothetical protein